MDNFIFTTWESILRITIVTIFAYGLIIFALRLSGNRSLSKINAFDFVVTIALGSILATLILDKKTPLLDGIYAFSLLLFLQVIVSFLISRIKPVKEVVTSKPSLLMFKGNFLKGPMEKERISKSEIYSALREKGINDTSKVEVVVLETNGNLSVITAPTNTDDAVLSDVNTYNLHYNK